MEKTNQTQALAIIPSHYLKQLYRICLPAGLVLWLAAVLIWIQGGLDQRVLFMLDNLRQQGTPLVVWMDRVSRFGLAAFTLVILFAVVTAHFQKRVTIPVAVLWLTICSFAISGIAGDLLKELIRRPRPTAVFAEQVVVWSDSLTSAIPSGHTTKAVAMILPFLFLVRDKSAFVKGIKGLLVLMALLMGASRIILGAHFLSDVLAGVGMALVGLPLSLSFGRMVLAQIPDEQLPKMLAVWSVLFIALTVIFIIL